MITDNFYEFKYQCWRELPKKFHNFSIDTLKKFGPKSRLKFLLEYYYFDYNPEAKKWYGEGFHDVWHYKPDSHMIPTEDELKELLFSITLDPNHFKDVEIFFSGYRRFIERSKAEIELGKKIEAKMKAMKLL